MSAITRFSASIPQAALDDLRDRLARTRWPDRETVTGWDQGVPLADAQHIVAYWRDHYDWRRCEAKLNRYDQFRTDIDGVGIHFLHCRSRQKGARPLLLTHGWPGSILEFVGTIDALIDPEAHGGRAEDAFHVVIPSLPGYGFSDAPRETGWTVERVAAAWAELMRRLGYGRYFAQGGDWGSPVTIALAMAGEPALAAIHLNLVAAIPKGASENPTAEERAVLDAVAHHARWNYGYSAQQSTRPQTLGYGLADSPVAQAMWIWDKYRFWMDCDGDPETVMAMDDLLDNITLYWLTNSGTSAARLYWESFHAIAKPSVTLPVGVSMFPGEVIRPPHHWVKTLFPNLGYWNEPARGGHFAAWEQPALFVDEMRRCFAEIG